MQAVGDSKPKLDVCNQPPQQIPRSLTIIVFYDSAA